MKISFFISLVPVAQGRARANYNARRMYDPAKSRKFKEDVARIAKQERPSGFEPFKGKPLGLNLEFIMPRLKNHPKRKIKPHIVKPDITNLAKGIEDALNGICYHDDSTIIEEHLYKRYALPGEEPGIRLELWRIEE